MGDTSHILILALERTRRGGHIAPEASSLAQVNKPVALPGCWATAGFHHGPDETNKKELSMDLLGIAMRKVGERGNN